MCLGLTWGTARLTLVGETSGLSTRLPTLPMLQREESGGAGKGIRKFLLGLRVRGRVWTEVAIGYKTLWGGEALCKKRDKKMR